MDNTTKTHKLLNKYKKTFYGVCLFIISIIMFFNDRTKVVAPLLLGFSVGYVASTLNSVRID